MHVFGTSRCAGTVSLPCMSHWVPKICKNFGENKTDNYLHTVFCACFCVFFVCARTSTQDRKKHRNSRTDYTSTKAAHGPSWLTVTSIPRTTRGGHRIGHLHGIANRLAVSLYLEGLAHTIGHPFNYFLCEIGRSPF
jgi:hypothetical protein